MGVTHTSPRDALFLLLLFCCFEFLLTLVMHHGHGTSCRYNEMAPPFNTTDLAGIATASRVQVRSLHTRGFECMSSWAHYRRALILSNRTVLCFRTIVSSLHLTLATCLLPLAAFHLPLATYRSQVQSMRDIDPKATWLMQGDRHSRYYFAHAHAYARQTICTGVVVTWGG